MKRILLFALLLINNADTFATWYYIPDVNFKNKLIALGYGACITNDSIDSNCPAVANETSLDISNSNIFDISGILAFTSLDTLVSQYNPLYNGPTITLPPTLTWLDITGAQCGFNLPQFPPSLIYLCCTFFNYPTLPSLPLTLKILKCEASSLFSLPSLPYGLEEIYCGSNYNLNAFPPLPATLKILDCHQCVFSSLPNLPNGLVTLNCCLNQLTSLPVLPDSLRSLLCYLNQISNLPTLPSGLQVLSCHSNHLSVLTALPVTMWYLDASYNQISSIDSLPPGLSECYLSSNLLTSLPPILQAQGTYLFCDYNQLTSLPPLYQVGLLNAKHNLLTSLPPLPSSLWNLQLDSNLISCLPALPNSLSRLEGIGAGYTCLPNLPPSLQLLTGPSLVCTAPCILLPTITGSVYDDLNLNFIRDTNETGHPNVIVEIQPGNYFGLTDNNGNYNIAVDDSQSFSISAHPPLYYSVSPASILTSSLNIGDVDSLNDFGLQPSGNISDLRISLQGLPVLNPGSTCTYFLQITNQGTVTQPAQVKMLPDTLFTFSNGNPPPDSFNGDTMIWNVNNIVPGGQQTFIITGIISSNTGALTSDIFYAFATSTLNEATPSDNVDTLTQMFGDPGTIDRKYVLPAGDITLSDVQSGAWMEYTVWFQNKSGTTISNVVVTDTLDPNLNPGTFQILSTSHPCSSSIYQGVAKFNFQNINLPDSAANPGSSYGYVNYRIKPDSFLIAGDFFINQATADFDAGYSTTTNLVTTTIVTATTTGKLSNENFSIYPNPTHGIINLAFDYNSEKLVVTLYDYTGIKILEKELIQKKINSIDLDDYNIKQGFYLLNITSADGTVMGRAGISFVR
jgi:uncharacterized repeat protein (TIGR01451 family)